ncbi:unnamed protein product [Schistosoma margrebowiei]|uniref:CPSF6/7 RSLD domain-containing protein n=1 Tax=Schistosoma margrebowiei TaxID=48269 RepID=A0A183MC49_9TREM|nr:unnamed protein product [Schistosoma margrebowiei]
MTVIPIIKKTINYWDISSLFIASELLAPVTHCKFIQKTENTSVTVIAYNLLSNKSTSKLSESEFEDILQRNKTVSSSAINRAVQDAAGGDYASAIETLVTAISLIKQSKIANDDRCRILINSLQDTLHGIESKSYGAKSIEKATFL